MLSLEGTKHRHGLVANFSLICLHGQVCAGASGYHLEGHGIPPDAVQVTVKLIDFSTIRWEQLPIDCQGDKR